MVEKEKKNIIYYILDKLKIKLKEEEITLEIKKINDIYDKFLLVDKKKENNDDGYNVSNFFIQKKENKVYSSNFTKETLNKYSDKNDREIIDYILKNTTKSIELEKLYIFFLEMKFKKIIQTEV